VSAAPQLDLDEETTLALDVARGLGKAGAPIFLAEPALDATGRWVPDGGHGKTGYFLPPRWQHTEADASILDDWRPGMAVCMVTGVVLDGVDVDPRHGGDQSAAGLQAAGAWPRSLGRQATPSGGWHDLVNSLGVRSRDDVLPGLDVKAGHDGDGHGFLFLAPTVKLSKTTGELGTYRWTQAPSFDELDSGDDSGHLLAERIAALRAAEDTEDTEDTEVPHDAYDAMSAATRDAVDRYLAGVVRRTGDELAEVAQWPIGFRDKHQRGWQKVLADVCNRFGRLARADWTPWTYDIAYQHLGTVVPAPMATAVGLKATWDAQRGRRTPAPYPETLATPDAVSQWLHSLSQATQESEPVEPVVPVAVKPPRPVAAVSLSDARAVCQRWLGADYDTDALTAVLAAAAVERLDGDPLWLLIVSGSGNAKTETVQALDGIGATVTSTISSEGALLSATSKRERTPDATGGLLRKIGDRGVLVIKDLTSVLSMSSDARGQVLGALREVYDGRWSRNVGTDGGRTLEWTGRIVTVGAVTTAWDQAHNVIATMGDRFVLLRMDSTTGRQAAGRKAIGNTGSEVQMRTELAEAVAGVVAGMDTDPTAVTEAEADALLAAADVVTLARTGVEYDYRGDVIDAHAPEMPTRFAKQLTQVVRGGIAIGLPRDDALRLAIRCARDSMPPMRLAILDDVAAYPDSSTADVRKRLGKPRSTVDRQLQALHMLGVLAVAEEQTEWAGKPATRWTYCLAEGIDPHALNAKSVPEKSVPTPNPQESRPSDGTPSRPPTDISGTDSPHGFPPPTGPGRCSRCGFHTPTQGHRAGCEAAA